MRELGRFYEEGTDEHFVFMRQRLFLVFGIMFMLSAANVGSHYDVVFMKPLTNVEHEACYEVVREYLSKDAACQDILGDLEDMFAHGGTKISHADEKPIISALRKLTRLLLENKERTVHEERTLRLSIMWLETFIDYRLSMAEEASRLVIVIGETADDRTKINVGDYDICEEMAVFAEAPSLKEWMVDYICYGKSGADSALSKCSWLDSFGHEFLDSILYSMEQQEKVQCAQIEKLERLYYWYSFDFLRVFKRMENVGGCPNKYTRPIKKRVIKGINPFEPRWKELPNWKGSAVLFDDL